jgi:hypothetical protein
LEAIMPLSIRFRQHRTPGITEQQVLSELVDVVRPILHKAWVKRNAPQELSSLA